VTAAQPGSIVRIQAGTYPERVTVSNKNSISGSTELHRIVIEADPAAAVGSVIVRPPAASCLNGYAILVRRSKFVTLRGLTITGAAGAGVTLLGGDDHNRAIHIEHSRIVGNGGTLCPAGGIAIALGNPDTVVANSLIHNNAGNGIVLADSSGGPHWVVQNTIYGNSWNGVGILLGQSVTLANNLIASNGRASGKLGGRNGIWWTGLAGKSPESVRLLNNLICGNRLGEIAGPLLDETDSGNFTPVGNEGTGVTARPGCEISGNVFSRIKGPDNLLNSRDDDFSLAKDSLAIDIGMDPRTLGLDQAFDSIFEADFVADIVRPSDGNGDRILAFDAGAFEYSNLPPLAHAGTDQTARRGQLVTLDGTLSSDPEGAPLSYHWTILSQPNGSSIALTGSSSAIATFTPLVLGDYAFRLVVSDGQYNSAPAMGSVIVINVAPAGHDANATTNEDTPVNITLSAGDTDDTSLSFTVASGVSNGTLSVNNGTMPCTNGTCAVSVTYTPAVNYHGTDSFTFTVSDGTTTSNPASVNITVTPVNDAAAANGVTAQTDEQSPVVITLSAGDVDSSTVSFTVVSGPSNGSVSPTTGQMTCISTGACSATLIYTPAPNFNGVDSFSFTASDGKLTSNIATATIVVNNVNDASTAQNGSASTEEDTDVVITLCASDIDSTDLTFTILNNPSHGSL
ncbi:MAG: Ig-like domain-containing protein, partial [Candidatus Binatia bacterium]